MAKWGTKNPPQRRGRYLITINTSFGIQVQMADRIEYPKDNWMWRLLPSGDISSESQVIAWQKCPQPYRG